MSTPQQHQRCQSLSVNQQSPLSLSINPAFNNYQKLVASTEDIGNHHNDIGNIPTTLPRATSSSSVVLTWTKAGYKVAPSLEALADMSEAVDLATIANFLVARPDYGIEWEGAVDTRSVNLLLLLLLL